MSDIQQYKPLTSLANHIKDNPLSQDEIIKLGIHICRDLELYSLKKAVHRDIKPDTIFISQSGDYTLGDFGITRQTEHATPEISKRDTYAYMAPEVFKGDECDASADTYSLGIIMYHFLIQNQTSFMPDIPTMSRMKGQPLPPIAGIDPYLNAVVLKACAYDRKARFSSASEIREALEVIARGGSYAPVIALERNAAERERKDGTAGVLENVMPSAARTVERASVTEDMLSGKSTSAAYEPHRNTTSRTVGVLNNTHNKPLKPVKTRQRKIWWLVGLAAVIVIATVIILCVPMLFSEKTVPALYLRDSDDDPALATTNTTSPELMPETIEIDLRYRDITDRQLYKMIQTGEIPRNVTSLSLYDNPISNISALSSLNELTKLNLFDTKISEIYTLSSLTKLKELSLDCKQINDLNPLFSLTHLERLFVSDIPESVLPLICSLKNLSQLGLFGSGSHAGVNDLTPLSSLTDLSKLYLIDPQTNDISPLSSLTNLTELYFIGTEISDITPLSALNNLTELYLISSEISDITPISALINLTILDLSNTKINNIAPLRPLKNLTRLGLTDTSLTKKQIDELQAALPNCVIHRYTPIFNKIPKSTEPVEINLYLQEITDEMLVEMIQTGEIPGDVTHLYFQKNLVSDISSLASLKSLTHLSLYGTQINDISPLSSLTDLAMLSLNSTQINDITPLSSLTGLSMLSLGSTQINNITPLSSLTDLSKLDLSSTHINDITLLSSLTDLTMLDLRGTQINDLTPLSSLKKLSYLDLGYSKIKEITPLSSFENLTELKLNDTQINDIKVLSSLTDLKKLYLSRTQINNIAALSSLTDLNELYLSRTQIKDIFPLSSLTNLTKLGLADTQVNDITPLSSLTDLTILYLSRTPISDISPLSLLTDLNWLELDDTQINDISPLSSLTKLTYLDLIGIKIYDITPLKSLKNLKTLKVNSNSLTQDQIDELKDALPNCSIW